MAVARQRMRAEQRREQLLDATRQLVDAEGFAAVTIEAVAQRCGVTRTLVYQQFGSLAGLLVAMVDREYLHAAAGFLAAIRRAPAPGETPFTAALSGVLDAVDAAPATWRMFLMPSEGGPPELHARLAEARAQTRRYLDAVLAAVPRADADRELTSLVMHAIADELVRLRLQDPVHFTRERLMAQAAWMTHALFAPAQP